MADHGFVYHAVPMTGTHAYVTEWGMDWASAMVSADVRGYRDSVAGNLN